MIPERRDSPNRCSEHRWVVLGARRRGRASKCIPVRFEQLGQPVDHEDRSGRLELGRPGGTSEVLLVHLFKSLFCMDNFLWVRGREVLGLMVYLFVEP